MPNEEKLSSPHTTRRYLLWLGLLIIFIIGVFVWLVVFPAASPQTSTQATFDVVVPQGAPMPTEADFISSQKGFNYLISYTGTSFSPSSLFVEKGEVVRFTNNSGAVLNLAVSKDDIKILGPGTYFEYATSDNGIVMYGDGVMQGSITVQ